MGDNNLLVPKNINLKASRTLKSKPKPSKPNEWWGIDMTKILTKKGWTYITIVVDWFTKEPLGWHIDNTSRANEWFSAVDMAVTNAGLSNNIRETNIKLMSDNGCQPTSKSFMQKCSILNITQAFTSYNNPKGNANTERFMRTMKEELLWLYEWENVNDVKNKLLNWLSGFKYNYRHSVLNYKTSNEFLIFWNKSKAIKENNRINVA